MKRIHLPIICLSLMAAAPAVAQPAGGGGGSSAPEPVSSSEFRLVIKDVAILDDGGAELKRHHCEWTEPKDEDKPCLAFSADPQDAYRAIKDAGGNSARVETQVPDLEIDTRTRIGERGDGTWLFRTEGTIDGRPHYAGYVCSAHGRRCTPYEAASKSRVQRAVRAAASRLKRRGR
jgi:hypothetical protein